MRTQEWTTSNMIWKSSSLWTYFQTCNIAICEVDVAQNYSYQKLHHYILVTLMGICSEWKKQMIMIVALYLFYSSSRSKNKFIQIDSKKRSSEMINMNSGEVNIDADIMSTYSLVSRNKSRTDHWWHSSASSFKW